MDINELKNVVEAALLASASPMSLNQIGQLFDEESAVTREALVQALDALEEDCTDRGVELTEVASGYRYQVRRSVYPWVSKMWTERPSRYSRAMLETLALIAYRQPITRGEIEQVRGVVVSSSIIRTLEEREWIRVVGHRDMPGRPALFGTTREFLDYFNLKSLDELPPLADIRELDDLDPQLDFDQPPRAGVSTPDPTDQKTQTTDEDISGQHQDAAPGDSVEREDATPPQDGPNPAIHNPDTPADDTTGDADTEHATDTDAAAQPPRATAEEAEVRAQHDHTEDQQPEASRSDDDRADAPNDTEENRA